ncbi:LD-carboxypeptidase [Nocardioidaceae bacterium SCSIO 66511]|nr:LD-carboxypeptidase [Nocardioidaceae bacterium SCSIO 66511]
MKKVIRGLTRRKVLVGSAAVAAGGVAGMGNGAAVASSRVRRPAMLKRGDTVRLISPASSPDAKEVERGEELLRGWGLEVEYAEHALDEFGYLAAPDAQRLADLNSALSDPNVRGVICTRGGYGVQRIIDGVDRQAVRRDPKPVVGFSDITGLQQWLWCHTGLTTIHGPMAAWNDDRNGPASAEALREALMTTKPITLSGDPDEPGGDVHAPGRATGVLLGGNLSLLAAAVGNRELASLRGAILFMEDVGESPYRLDRMLTQLRRSGVLDGVAGFALGQWTDCEGAPGEWTVSEMFRDRLGDLDVPILGGLPVGHGNGQLTMPLGVRAELDADSGTLTAEPAVRAA